MRRVCVCVCFGLIPIALRSGNGVGEVLPGESRRMLRWRRLLVRPKTLRDVIDLKNKINRD